MKTTKIEWTEKVWNPSIGCDKVSAGCKFYYAEVFSRRLGAMGVEDYKDGFAFKILPHRLEKLLKIKKPTVENSKAKNGMSTRNNCTTKKKNQLKYNLILS